MLFGFIKLKVKIGKKLMRLRLCHPPPSNNTSIRWNAVLEEEEDVSNEFKFGSQLNFCVKYFVIEI